VMRLAGGRRQRRVVGKEVRRGGFAPLDPPPKAQPLESVHLGEGIGKGRAEVRSETAVKPVPSQCLPKTNGF
jgi:hypothetical protein